jgi:hypothetical protein
MDTTHICERCDDILYNDDGVIRLSQTMDKCIETWFCEPCWVKIKEMVQQQTCCECDEKDIVNEIQQIIEETKSYEKIFHEGNPDTLWQIYKDFSKHRTYLCIIYHEGIECTNIDYWKGINPKIKDIFKKYNVKYEINECFLYVYIQHEEEDSEDEAEDSEDEAEDCCNMNCTNKATKFQILDDPSCSITGDGRDWYCQKCYSDCVGDE